MQFHLLSFEGPDPYARVGGLATRVEGLSQTLADQGFETHLWFVGDPALAGQERRGDLQLHRWCQWLSNHHPGGVYDGDDAKARDYCESLPPYLYTHFLRPALRRGERAVILAEEWQTVDAVLHLDSLLRHDHLRDRVSILWNANNTYRFDGIDWSALEAAATVTTVSTYMKRQIQGYCPSTIVVPNGLPNEAFELADRRAVRALRRRLEGRSILAKMARWDRDKRWTESMAAVAALKDQGLRPILLAKGGAEAHSETVLQAARDLGLRVSHRDNTDDARGLLGAVEGSDDVDVIVFNRHVTPAARSVLFRGSDVVLANSVHEPFGLVGLETMAVGGIACTGGTGEDYVVPGSNALVVSSGEPAEFADLFSGLATSPKRVSLMRRRGRQTAKAYAWSQVLNRDLFPHCKL